MRDTRTDGRKERGNAFLGFARALVRLMSTRMSSRSVAGPGAGRPLLAALTVMVCLATAEEASAAITFVGNATQTASSGVTRIGIETQGDDDATLTIDVPAGTAVGDVLIAQIAKDNSTTTLPTPAGWTKFADDVMSGTAANGTRQAIYYKVVAAPADATGSVTWNHGGNLDSAGAIWTYRGLDTSNPIDAYSGNSDTGNTTSLVATGITTTAADEVLLAFYAVNASNRNFTAPAGFTERYEQRDADNVMEIMGADGLQASAGATGDKTATLNNNVSRWVAHLVALRAAPMALTISIPGGTAEGDVMVAQITVRDSTSDLPIPTDWTKIGGADAMAGDATSGVRQAAYYKVATAADLSAGTVTWSLPGVGTAAGAILSYRGVSTASPIDTGSSNSGTTNTTSIVATGVTTSEDGAWLVGLYAVNGSRAFTPPGSFAERYEEPNGTALEVSGADFEQATAGAGGDKTATLDAAANRWVAHLVALRPTPLTCFTDGFTGADDSAPGTDWLVSSSSGSFGTPRIVNNRLRLTDASANVATMANLQRLFPGAGNRIEVEFEHFAYGGSGADGIAIVFSDADVTPGPGSYGGSLGYAQRDDGTSGFAGGWLGVGIDEYGNFSAPTEGRVGGPGLTIDSVSIRGSGSGTSGYDYHTGTGTLSPQVDNNGAASPPHRYRIIVDHSNGVNAFVSVERDTGSGYATLIAPYDAKAQAGQAAVPTSWILSYTGSTGGANNIHEIDELRICATSQTPIAALASFEITVAASASVCVPHTVTITARDASNNVYTDYTGTITLSTSTNHGTWALPTSGTIPQGTLTAGADNGAATYTFVAADNGSIVLTLDNERAENLTITGVDVTVPTSSQTTGVVSYLDNAFVVTPTDALGTTAVAGRNHGMQAALWRCERVDPTTCNTCAVATAYAGDRSLDAWITRDVDDPSGAAPTMTGTEVLNGPVALPNAAPGADNLQLRFVNGVAPFNLSTTDVGKYLLNLRDDSRTFADAVDVAGASATMTTRPFGLGFTQIRKGVLANPGGTASGGNRFVAAGDTFEATVSGYLWAGADDANNDGVPDAGADITNNGVTPSYAWDTTVAASAAGFTPAGGGAVVGTVGGTSPIPGASFSGGGATVADLTYSEVGSVLLSAVAQDYLNTSGVSVTGASGTVGRFYPAYFALTAGSVTPGCGTFTYMGQNTLGISYTVEAKNLGGGTTANYDVAKGYTHAGLGVVGLRLEDNNDGTDLTARLSGSPGATWTAGVYDASTAAAAFNRAAAPDGAFENLLLGVEVQDSDGAVVQARDMNPTTTGDCVATNTCVARSIAAITRVRFGRLFHQNAYGAELGSIPAPSNERPFLMTAQYYAGASTGFVTNGDDNCTTVSGADLRLSNSDATIDGPGSIVVGSGSTTADIVNSPLVAGNAGLWFSAPGPGGDGYVDFTFGATLPPAWLLYDWDVDGAHDDPPTGRVTFGIFRGSPRQIHRRELFN